MLPQRDPPSRERVPGIAHLSQGLSETQDLDALESEHRLVFWLHWVFEMECKLFVATLRGFSPVVMLGFGSGELGLVALSKTGD